MKSPSILYVTAALVAMLMPLAKAQQILAPDPDDTTVDFGEVLSIEEAANPYNDLDPFTVADGGTIEKNGSLVNNVGARLVIDEGGTFNNNDGGMDNYGTVDNSGTLRNFSSLYNGGTINNSGFFVNDPTGLQDFENEGTINNSGMMVTYGRTENQALGTINNSVDGEWNVFSRLVNEGTINNNGLINIYGLFDNGGDLINHGILNHYNNSPASVYNYGSFINYGTFNNNGSWENDRPVTNHGTFNNNGTWGVAGSAASDAVTNHGTLNNNGEFSGLGDNYGDVNNNGELSLAGDNYGTFNNNLGAQVSWSPLYTFNNYGLLNNDGLMSWSVDVKTGGVLTGSGIIENTLGLEGAISPGNSIGTISVGNQIWHNGGSYTWEVNDSDGVAGGTVGWDLIATEEYEIGDFVYSDGELDLSQLTTGGFAIDIISLDALNELGAAEGFDDPNAEYEFVIVTTVGGITGFEAEDFVINDDGFQNSGSWEWGIAQDGNNLVLSAMGHTLVPEPSSVVLLGLGGLTVLLRRKRS